MQLFPNHSPHLAGELVPMTDRMQGVLFVHFVAFCKGTTAGFKLTSVARTLARTESDPPLLTETDPLGGRGV